VKERVLRIVGSQPELGHADATAAKFAQGLVWAFALVELFQELSRFLAREHGGGGFSKETLVGDAFPPRSASGVEPPTLESSSCWHVPFGRAFVK